jgi:hypothetical protein
MVVRHVRLEELCCRRATRGRDLREDFRHFDTHLGVHVAFFALRDSGMFVDRHAVSEVLRLAKTIDPLLRLPVRILPTPKASNARGRILRSIDGKPSDFEVATKTTHTHAVCCLDLQLQQTFHRVLL